MPVGKKSINRANNLKVSQSKPSIKHDMPVLTTAKLYISSLINPPEEWIFYSNSSSELEALKASINKYGIIEPIIVRKLEDDIFQILSGQLRVKAASQLGIEEIKSEIIENLTYEEAHEIFMDLHKDKSSVSEFSRTKFKAISMIKNDLPDYLL